MTHTKQKQSKNKQRTVKAMNSMFNNLFLLLLIDFTDWQHSHIAGVHTSHYNFYKFSSQPSLTVSRAKNRSQHRENLRLDHSRFHHMPRLPVNYVMLLLIQICSQKDVQNPFQMQKCKFWWQSASITAFKMMVIVRAGSLTLDLHYAELLYCDPRVSLAVCTVIHLKLTVPPLQVIGTYHKYSLKENRTMNTAVNEMSDFINIFQVTFEEKIPNFKTSYLSFYCKFKVIPNAGLKSKICSVRLQNFIFVQWELAQDKSMKRNDPFRDSKKKKCCGVCASAWG